MIRSRLCSSVLLCGLVALGSTACSFSFKAGGSASGEAGKPAHGHDEHEHGSSPSSKPIAQTDPAPAADPPGEEADDDPGPTRVPPSGEETPPVVEPQLTAVCRTGDEALEALCHRGFDPIAADDLSAWVSQLAKQAVLTRPVQQQDMKRMQGAELIEALAQRSGGLRSMMHLRPTDRVVVTVSDDCRACRRSFVAFEANTRSGTVGVTFDMTQPPTISAVEIDRKVRRRHLGKLRNPVAEEPAAEEPAAEEPAAEEPAKKDEPRPTLEAPPAQEIVTPPKDEPAAKPAKKEEPRPTIKAPKKEIVTPAEKGGQ